MYNNSKSLSKTRTNLSMLAQEKNLKWNWDRLKGSSRVTSPIDIVKEIHKSKLTTFL